MTHAANSSPKEKPHLPAGPVCKPGGSMRRLFMRLIVSGSSLGIQQVLRFKKFSPINHLKNMECYLTSIITVHTVEAIRRDEFLYRRTACGKGRFTAAHERSREPSAGRGTRKPRRPARKQTAGAGTEKRPNAGQPGSFDYSAPRRGASTPYPPAEEIYFCPTCSPPPASRPPPGSPPRSW